MSSHNKIWEELDKPIQYFIPATTEISIANKKYKGFIRNLLATFQNKHVHPVQHNACWNIPLHASCPGNGNKKSETTCKNLSFWSTDSDNWNGKKN